MKVFEQDMMVDVFGCFFKKIEDGWEVLGSYLKFYYWEL